MSMAATYTRRWVGSFDLHECEEEDCSRCSKGVARLTSCSCTTHSFFVSASISLLGEKLRKKHIKTHNPYKGERIFCEQTNKNIQKQQ